MEKIIFKMPLNNKAELLENLADEATMLMSNEGLDALLFAKHYGKHFAEREKAIQTGLYLSADAKSIGRAGNFRISVNTHHYWFALLRYNDFEITNENCMQLYLGDDYYIKVVIVDHLLLNIHYMYDPTETADKEHLIIIENIPIIRTDLFLHWFKEIQLLINLNIKDLKLDGVLDVCKIIK